MSSVFVAVLLAAYFTESAKKTGLLPQKRQYLLLFISSHCLPTSHAFCILVGVQSGFSANGFVEAEHG